MIISHNVKNALKFNIIRKVSARPNIWARNDADYPNKGYKTRMFKEIENEIRLEMNVTILGNYYK